MAEHFRFPLLSRDELHLSLQQRLNNASEQGFDKGFDKGYAQGIVLGNQQAKEQLDELLRQEYEAKAQQQLQQVQQQNQKQLDALLKKFQQRLMLEEKHLSKEIAELVRAISEAVLDAELSLKPQHYLNAVEQVLENLHGRDRIDSIQVTEADGQWLQTQGISKIAGLFVSIDESLGSGQVQFSGESQLHLLSFSQRLEEVLAQVKHILLDVHED
jgi:flagellar biosynthesis/type III secretory pathway protein FliH